MLGRCLVSLAHFHSLLRFATDGSVIQQRPAAVLALSAPGTPPGTYRRPRRYASTDYANYKPETSGTCIRSTNRGQSSRDVRPAQYKPPLLLVYLHSVGQRCNCPSHSVSEPNGTMRYNRGPACATLARQTPHGPKTKQNQIFVALTRSTILPIRQKPSRESRETDCKKNYPQYEQLK